MHSVSVSCVKGVGEIKFSNDEFFWHEFTEVLSKGYSRFTLATYADAKL